MNIKNQVFLEKRKKNQALLWRTFSPTRQKNHFVHKTLKNEQKFDSLKNGK